MTQRRQYLRHDYNPSLATGTGFQVAEGIVRLIAHGLSTGESVGIEMRLYANGDERWTPYAPCNGQLALTSTNTVIRIADTGEYRLTPAATLGQVVILLQEDEANSDAKVVYNVPVSACLPEAGGGSGGPTHPPLSLSIVPGAPTSLDALNQILTVNNDPVVPTHLPVTFIKALLPSSFDAVTQTLTVPIEPTLTVTPSTSSHIKTITYNSNDGNLPVSTNIRDTVRVSVDTTVGIFSTTVLGGNITDPYPVEYVVNGIIYSDPTDIDVNISQSGTPGVLFFNTQWVSPLFNIDTNDKISIKFNQHSAAIY